MMPSAYQPVLPSSPTLDPESGEYIDQTKVGRKKSLVRPDREKIEPGHRQWHYHNTVAQLQNDGGSRLGVMPSSMCLSIIVLSTTIIALVYVDRTHRIYNLFIQLLEIFLSEKASGEESRFLPEMRMCTSPA
jgi:hypothetical protein